jgi:hypothetical protein
MPPVKKLEKFFEILNDLDDETMSLISRPSEDKKLKFFKSLHKVNSTEINLRRIVFKLK